ncbi:MAG: rod shape-determining protein MreC [Bacteroidales bacterium]|nr:rod shape-determining protein MreC [Bacteroidales bacterium]
MRNLIQFFVKHSSFFVFLFFAIISFVLLIRFNSYHQSVFFSSANSMVANVYSISGDISSYFGLKQVNEDLLERNLYLEKKLLVLQEMLDENNIQSELADEDLKYDFIPAQVINNSVTKIKNYITLNKGVKDSVEVGMGVADQNGIIGIVALVSDHFAVVNSILNPKWSLSAKVLGSDYFGSLVWDGENSQYAVLEELPRHVEFEKGDTIITSGFSTAFPEGLPVGIVEGYNRQKNDNFYSVKVKLFADFNRLKSVRVIKNKDSKEQLNIEKEVNN